MQLPVAQVLVLAAATAQAKPILNTVDLTHYRTILPRWFSSWSWQASSPSTLAQAIKDFEHDIFGGPRTLNILKTTTHNGQVVDWIETSSQGKVASPPPHFPSRSSSKRGSANGPITKAPIPIHPDPGPPGTVPFARHNSTRPEKADSLPGTTKSQSQSSSSKARTSSDGTPQPAEDPTAQNLVETHWYAASVNPTPNHGGGGSFNIWDAYVQNPSDFNIMQVAVALDHNQTVEAGWQHYDGVQTGGPALFTYWTNNGYTKYGDYLGGYDAQVGGWVQVDKDIYPGVHLSPLSTTGGTQVEIDIHYYLFQGNWWLRVLDRWIGYYPGALFADNDKGQSLAKGANTISVYGEVLNGGKEMTTTDMGSGEFPSAGFGKAAFIRNVEVYTPEGKTVDYNTAAGNVVISDPKRYDLEVHWASGTAWGSYLYVGGPGAGGKIGA
ncbi:hypothetical protein VHEMI04747 [[Torrubiella] hemipterigena]|uniref:Neprosin PEP catalytic domain-containing protein n=1 Tax=[Torrubiella] hemipterigena TaxID=1531966 RepID=A0A0A1TER1_9HYPO|nr:hypothetical protein VHEMI04747 [[Torrubiella] hemipterigena]